MLAKRGITPRQAKQIRADKGIQDSRLQKIRVKRGLSQGELAELSGVSLRKIQSYEQRQRFVDGAKLDTICDLCLALNCKIEDILESKATAKKIMSLK